ncbi:MAG: hypothetical protein Q7R81_05470 [Candidatus Peregrinibacteria bacterium]|nr:hypothetical protein [Candidatus Peregrinibacteria bacterium]
MRLSKKMEDLKEVLGSRYTRHDKWCFAAVLTGATLGQGWEDVLETLAKRIGDVNRRKAVNRIVVKVEGVMLLSHENPDAFTDVIFTFQDSEGRIVTMQCPLDPSPDLVQLTFQFVVGRLKKEDLWAALKILTDIRVERPAVPAAPMPPVGR